MAPDRRNQQTPYVLMRIRRFQVNKRLLGFADAFCQTTGVMSSLRNLHSAAQMVRRDLDVALGIVPGGNCLLGVIQRIGRMFDKGRIELLPTFYDGLMRLLDRRRDMFVLG